MTCCSSRLCLLPAALGVVAGLVAASLAHAQAADPDAYWSTIDPASGTPLINQLEARMSLGHTQTSYGTARQALKFTDADPDVPGNVLLVYNRFSTDGDWQDGAFDSREHVWPRSRLGIDGSNGTQGRFGDLHMLKPLDQGTNSNRSNLSFGLDNTTGPGRQVGSYWYPGDADRGDVARIAFYGATRWRGDGLALVEGTGLTSRREMGDLSSLLAWHYLDAPDAFELNRNQVAAEFYTRNRNAYIDRPEYAWAVFAGDDNDTRLTIAGEPASADGATTVTRDLGKVLAGTPLPDQSFTIAKAGVDGTYYRVASSGDVTADVNGRYNAFAIGSAGSRVVNVALDPAATAAPGAFAGSVTVDNLDVTTAGGTGRGANDGDDVVSFIGAAVAGSNPSFAADADLDALTLDLGIVGQGLGDYGVGVDVFNLDLGNLGSDLVAGLDLDGIGGVGPGFSPFTFTADASDIAAGESAQVVATLTDVALGSFTLSVAIGTSDADDVLGGSAAFSDSLTLDLLGEVRLAGDADGNDAVDLADFGILRGSFGDVAGVGYGEGDFNRDGTVDLADFGILRSNFGGSAGQLAALDAWAASVPEPTLGLLALSGGLFLIRRRR